MESIEKISEEWVNENLCKNCSDPQKSQNKCAVCGLFMMSYNCFFNGYLEMQKRLKLEKKNAELEVKLKGFENGDVAWQGDMDATIQQNIELKAQIEKMKNVGNCKKAMTCAEWNEKQTILCFMKFCKGCKEWELAK